MPLRGVRVESVEGSEGHLLEDRAGTACAWLEVLRRRPHQSGCIEHGGACDRRFGVT